MIDVLRISETKIDGTFSVGNLIVKSFSTPCCLGRDSNGGGIMLYNSEDIPSNLLVTEERHHVEGFYVESNLRRGKGC